MHTRTSLLALSLVGFVLASAGCDALGPETELSADEARALALAVDDASAAVADEQAEGASYSLAPAGEPSYAEVTTEYQLSMTRQCPVSGSASLTAEGVSVVDSEAGTGSLDLTGSRSHDACTFATPRGVQITVDGSISLVLARDWDRNAGTASGSQTHTGTLTYVTSSGKEGSCSIDITASFNLSVSSGTATRTVQGTVCDRTIDHTTSWTRSQS